ncbi:MAG: hypothetical protein WC666_03345 [Candidatus Paceibacterota bacterium]|jgi:hypothetical protein
MTIHEIGVEIFNTFSKKHPKAVYRDSARRIFVQAQTLQDFQAYHNHLIKYLGEGVVAGNVRDLPVATPCAIYSFILGSKKVDKNYNDVLTGYLIHVPFSHVDGILIAQATKRRTHARINKKRTK